MRKLILMSIVAAAIGSGGMAAQTKIPHLQVESMSDALTAIPEESMSISADSTMLIGVATDSDGIKVQVELLPGMMQQRALRDGLVVYFDVSGKKKSNYYVQFPKKEMSMDQLPTMPAEPPAQGEPMPMPTVEELSMDVAKLAAEQASLFQDKEEMLMPTDNAKISVVGDRLVYTCYVPLSKLSSKRDKNERYNVGVGFKAGRMGMRPSGDMQRPGGGPGGEGMRGGPGGPGGMRGGGPGGPGGPGGMRGGQGRPDGMPNGEGTEGDGSSRSKRGVQWYIINAD